MLGEKLFDCHEMFRHACAFCECADMAMEKHYHKSADIETYDIPAMVNSAFACEVFLKALLKYYDINYKNEHRLKSLYNMLPIDIGLLIHLQLLTCSVASWGQESLEDISDTFVHWRYSYEQDYRKNPFINYDTGPITAFRNVLREACCEIFFGEMWITYEKSSMTVYEF